MEANESYLESVKKQFLYYKMLGEKAMDQLEAEQLFVPINEDTNSIATIIKHISGNMLSRWTDFLTSDGEKEWRNRDDEFENEILSKAELLALWEKGWQCLFDALDSIAEIPLDTIIYIRNEKHTLTEAINRQLAHLPYHIGQIIYIAKMIEGENWQSLTIPKGASTLYNKGKLGQ